MIAIFALLLLQVADDTSVRTTTIVDGKTMVSGKPVPPAQTGVTIDPVMETPERAMRRDAMELRETQRFRSSGLREQPVETTTVVGTIVSQKKGLSETSCVQIGVVGHRDNCRPTKSKP